MCRDLLIGLRTRQTQPNQSRRTIGGMPVKHTTLDMRTRTWHGGLVLKSQRIRRVLALG